MRCYPDAGYLGTVTPARGFMCTTSHYKDRFYVKRLIFLQNTNKTLDEPDKDRILGVWALRPPSPTTIAVESRRSSILRPTPPKSQMPPNSPTGSPARRSRPPSTPPF